MNTSNSNKQKIHAKIMYEMAWQLLKERKFILLLPVLGSLILLTLVLGLLYFTHLLIQHISPQLIIELQQQQSYTATEIIFIILSLFVTYFIGIFIFLAINSAIILCTQEMINNRSFSIKQVFYTLYVRKLKIFQWAIFFGVIGLLINILEFISDTITDLLISFIGFSFYSLSWLVMPIIMEQNLSPIEAIYQAKELLSHAFWTERIFLRSCYLDWRLWIGQMLFFGLFLFTFSSHFPEHYKIITIAISLTGFTVFLLLHSVLFTILKAMAYEYVTNQFFNKKIQQADLIMDSRLS